jgi:hypothetical protein
MRISEVGAQSPTDCAESCSSHRTALETPEKTTPGPLPIRLGEAPEKGKRPDRCRSALAKLPKKANARTVADPGVLRDDVTRQPP